MEAGGVEFLKRVMTFYNTGRAIMSAKYEAKLNKNEQLHPTVTLNDLSQQKLINFLQACKEFDDYQQQLSK